jgi:hypothetical protein
MLEYIKRMKKRQRKKRHKQGQKVYGESFHYWPEKMLRFALSAACIQVVLDNSERAKCIYGEAVEAWSRDDCQEVLNETKIQFSRCITAMRAIESENISEWTDPLEDTYAIYRDSKDFEYLIDRINEFIKVGFNRAAEQARGIYKVKPSREHWLFYTVFVRTLVDFADSKPDFEENRIVGFAGLLFDPATFLNGTPSNRFHRFRTKQYKSHDYRLSQDYKPRNSAWYWYQCRVIYSGPEEFCKKYLIEQGIE